MPEHVVFIDKSLRETVKCIFIVLRLPKLLPCLPCFWVFIYARFCKKYERRLFPFALQYVFAYKMSYSSVRAEPLMPEKVRASFKPEQFLTCLR